MANGGRSNYLQQFYIFYISWFSEFDNFRSNQICEDLLSREEGLSLAKKDNEFKYDVFKNFSEIIGFNLDDIIEKLSLYLNYISIYYGLFID